VVAVSLWCALAQPAAKQVLDKLGKGAKLPIAIVPDKMAASSQPLWLVPSNELEQLISSLASFSSVNGEIIHTGSMLPGDNGSDTEGSQGSGWVVRGEISLKQSDYYGWLLSSLVQKGGKTRQLMLSLERSASGDTLLLSKQPTHWFACTVTGGVSCPFDYDVAGAVTGCMCDDSLGVKAVFKEKQAPVGSVQ